MCGTDPVRFFVLVPIYPLVGYSNVAIQLLPLLNVTSEFRLHRIHVTDLFQVLHLK